ncbi:uncharacterized protein LOC128921409 [Zeugodacus cucurbitae]|uniref:uncharacterized protein LOC128921409 n=1 Tax=Zeugodacus cucurbitae TaxID=28588 RepID=UPI0023D94F0E|nr:uncharacterized protein LOC128921409 [Zeugodacus cucurbitae]
MEIREKLAEFNQLFEIESNIFIYNSSDVDISDYISKETPVILVNRLESDFKLIYKVNKNALVVVLLSESNRKELLSVLNEFLTRLRQLKVLLVLSNTMSDVETQLTLFQWAWQSGYTRIMSLHASPSANGTHITLTSYTPFPELQLITVEQPEDYFRYTLPHDFQGHPIRTPLGQNPPGVFLYKDRNGQEQITGMAYSLFANFIKLHNATLQEVMLPAPYPEIVEHERIIEALARDELDISVHFYFADYDKWHITDTPFLWQQFFRVPHAKPRPVSDCVLAPFEIEVRLFIFVYLCCVTVVFTCGSLVASKISWLRRKTPPHRVSSTFIRLPHIAIQYLSAFIDHFLHLLALLCFNANRHNQGHHNNSRLMLMYRFHAILAFILVNIYNTLIVSFLTTEIFEPQMSSVADVIASPYQIQIVEMDRHYFPNDTQLCEKLVVTSRAEFLQQLSNLNDSVILMTTAWTHAFYELQELNLKVKRVHLLTSEIIWHAFCGMLMPLNSPYVEMLSIDLLRSFDAGLFWKAYLDATLHAIEGGILTMLPAEKENFFVLNVEYFLWAWCLCIGGLVLSSVVFLIEIYSFNSTRS